MNFKLKTMIATALATSTLLLAQPVLAEMYAANPNLGNTPMEGTATFEAFGGKEGLVKIMDDFMIGLVADPRTKAFFDNDKQTFIKAMLVEQFQFAMDKHNVPFAAQNKLLAKLAPMYREIETTTGKAVPPNLPKTAM